MGKRTVLLATVLLASVSAGAVAQSPGPASDGFTGRWLAPECGLGGTVDADGEPQRVREQRCEGYIGSSDPRFTGTYVSVFNLDTYRGEAFAPDEGAFNVWTIVRRVENDEGAWQGKATTAVWVDDPEAWFIDEPPATVVFTGEGSYEGLTAIVTIGERVVNSAFRGYIFPGSAPPEPSLTAVLFVSASVTMAGAQSPPPDDAATRTVEIPGSGATVTLPRQWRTWVAESDGQPISVRTTDLVSGWMCRIASDEIASEQNLVSAEAASDAITEGAEYNPPFEIATAEPFEVPTGSAVLVTFGSPERDPWYRIERIVLVDAPQGVVRVSCGSAPADHASDVARTIAPLASDDVPEPFDPRVELAAHGFAVDFGPEWGVSSRMALLGAQGTLLGGTPVLSAGVSPNKRDGPTHRCSIEDDSDVPGLTGLTSVADWRAAIKDAGKGTLHAKKPAMKVIDLASGPAFRADWQTRPAQTTAWIVSDAEHLLVLRCASERPPKDHWRSIAETIEFLPVEE